LLEKDLHLMTCEFLKKNYPKVIFRTDFAAGIRLTPGMAKRQKALQWGNAYPDLFIAEARQGYNGLFIELKTVSNVVFKKDGSLRKNQHHEEQAAMLELLRKRGYKAEFGQGLANIINIINDYLK